MRAEQEPTANLRIVGDKIVLRSKLVEDAEADYSWRIDPELARLDATRPITLTFSEFLRYHRDDVNYPSPWSVRLAIESAEGLHIGNCMYYDINKDASKCELGIMIGDRDYWSKGYGTDVIKTALRHIFTTTKLNLVYLHTLSDNFRAQRSFTKAGFKPVDEVRREGHDFVYMEVTREEWEQANPEAVAVTEISTITTTARINQSDPLPGQ